MKNITKTIQILSVALFLAALSANLVLAQGAPPVDSTDSSTETSESSAPPVNSTDASAETNDSSAPPANPSEPEDQNNSSNTETPTSSNSTPDNQGDNTSYDALAGSCSADVSSIDEGESVTWTANVTGGNNMYSYNWSGDDSISGTSQSISHTYNTAGAFSADVEVSSPAFDESENLNLNCGDVVVNAIVSTTTPTTTDPEPETTSGGGGGSSRRSTTTETPQDTVEEDLTTDEIVAFLETLAPQENANNVVGTENVQENEVDDVNTDQNDENQDSNNGTTSIEQLADDTNDQLAGIGNVNLDWLNRMFEGAWPLAWILIILAILGISYSTWKKFKKTK
jgi:hypothetical protein